MKFVLIEYEVTRVSIVSLKARSAYGVKTAAFYMPHESYFSEVKNVAMGSDPQAKIEELFQMYAGFIQTI